MCSATAEPHRAGGHLSPARGAARPLPRAVDVPYPTARPSATSCSPPPARERGRATAVFSPGELLRRRRSCADAGGRGDRGDDPRPRARLPPGDRPRPPTSPSRSPGARAPRGQALMLAGAGRGAAHGPPRPSPEDVRASRARAKHRMALSFAPRAQGAAPHRPDRPRPAEDPGRGRRVTQPPPPSRRGRRLAAPCRRWPRRAPRGDGGGEHGRRRRGWAWTSGSTARPCRATTPAHRLAAVGRADGPSSGQGMADRADRDVWWTGREWLRLGARAHQGAPARVLGCRRGDPARARGERVGLGPGPAGRRGPAMLDRIARPCRTRDAHGLRARPTRLGCPPGSRALFVSDFLGRHGARGARRGRGPPQRGIQGGSC
jgi:hypothetical protein